VLNKCELSKSWRSSNSGALDPGILSVSFSPVRTAQLPVGYERLAEAEHFAPQVHETARQLLYCHKRGALFRSGSYQGEARRAGVLSLSSIAAFDHCLMETMVSAS
jgi:hypothetical protein